ncbi:hypothetical protein MHM582_2563 [Microbacterium sp. HM58-2]|nr:hypothetical protein MHM582_2563 [Microbacterium sp. HM58-2]
MPTFDNPAADAAEASAALRALAHATRRFDDPADLYGLLGDVLSGVRSLQQTLEQLAAAHDAHRPRARDDDGDADAGAWFALKASSELFSAAKVLDQVESAVNLASQASGRVAWVAPGQRPDRRYVSVVFLQGEEAEQALRLLHDDGPAAAIDHLARRDRGDETTQAALSNGYVYDAPPVGQLDELQVARQYALIANPLYRYVSLLREYAPEPEPQNTTPSIGAKIADIVPRPSTPEFRSSSTSRPQIGGISSERHERVRSSWFEHPGIAEVKRLRGLEL